MNYHISLDIDFKRNTFPGRYIALEGIDGSGKSSQRDALAVYFEEQGKEVVKTREPRKTEGIVGRIIAEILKGETKVPPAAFQYLFTADRVIHYEEVIYPSLRDGKVVLSDRCFWSAIPYGILDKMTHEGNGDYNINDAEAILVGQSILSMYHEFMVPDYTFYLAVPVEVGMQRMKERNEKKEIYDHPEKLAKIIEGYEWLVREFPQEITKIDAVKSVEAVTMEILSRISST